MLSFTSEKYDNTHLMYDEVQFNAWVADRRYAAKYSNKRNPNHTTCAPQRLRETGSVVSKNNETGPADVIEEYVYGISIEKFMEEG